MCCIRLVRLTATRLEPRQSPLKMICKARLQTQLAREQTPHRGLVVQCQLDPAPHMATMRCTARKPSPATDGVEICLRPLGLPLASFLHHQLTGDAPTISGFVAMNAQVPRRLEAVMRDGSS